jgi:hypothetical protein
MSNNIRMHITSTGGSRGSGSAVVIDNNKYETAKQYAERAIEIFDSELKP